MKLNCTVEGKHGYYIGIQNRKYCVKLNSGEILRLETLQSININEPVQIGLFKNVK